MEDNTKYNTVIAEFTPEAKMPVSDTTTVLEVPANAIMEYEVVVADASGKISAFKQDKLILNEMDKVTAETVENLSKNIDKISKALGVEPRYLSGNEIYEIVGSSEIEPTNKACIFATLDDGHGSRHKAQRLSQKYKHVVTTKALLLNAQTNSNEVFPGDTPENFEELEDVNAVFKFVEDRSPF